MEEVRSPSPERQDCILKSKFPTTACCQTLLRILFQIWEYLITNTMIDNIENKIEDLRLQEYSLKNRFCWKLVISLETYIKQIR